MTASLGAAILKKKFLFSDNKVQRLLESEDLENTKQAKKLLEEQ